jgi:hypothetical protein
MNPYLEASDDFSTVHRMLIDEIHAAIVANTDGRYVVRSDITVYIEEPSASERMRIKPDVMVLGPYRGVARAAVAPSRAARYVELGEAEVVELAGLRVVDARNNELVTAVELLSPANKLGEGRGQYLLKRNRLLGHVNLVEIDLLRRGPRMPMRNLPPCDYCAVVAQPAEYPQGGIFAWSLREPIPVIPIPLRPEDQAVEVDFQAALHRVYDRGGFGRYIYSLEPEPPLGPDDAGWAREIAASARSGR